jgi:transcriptional regulator with XRE-family HTH domain
VQSLSLAPATTYVLARYPAGAYHQGPVPTIGENIKQARLAAGIKTQGELAKILGVPQPQLSDWENDRYGAPDTKTLLMIAGAIPCEFDVLVVGIDDRYDSTRSRVHRSRTDADTQSADKTLPLQSDNVSVTTAQTQGARSDPALHKVGDVIEVLRAFSDATSNLQAIAENLAEYAARLVPSSRRKRTITRRAIGSGARVRRKSRG